MASNRYPMKREGKRIVIKPIIEKDVKGNVKVKVPNMATISKAIKENDKRNL